MCLMCFILCVYCEYVNSLVFELIVRKFVQVSIASITPRSRWSLSSRTSPTAVRTCTRWCSSRALSASRCSWTAVRSTRARCSRTSSRLWCPTRRWLIPPTQSPYAMLKSQEYSVFLVSSFIALALLLHWTEFLQHNRLGIAITMSFMFLHASHIHIHELRILIHITLFLSFVQSIIKNCKLIMLMRFRRTGTRTRRSRTQQLRSPTTGTSLNPPLCPTWTLWSPTDGSTRRRSSWLTLKLSNPPTGVTPFLVIIYFFYEFRGLLKTTRVMADDTDSVFTLYSYSKCHYVLVLRDSDFW